MNYEELVKALRCDWMPDDSCKRKCPYADSHGYCDMDKVRSSAADAIEALLPKRGEWIFDGKFMELHKFRCSNCKRTEFRMSDYCPNCGADMRKLEVQE